MLIKKKGGGGGGGGEKGEKKIGVDHRLFIDTKKRGRRKETKQQEQYPQHIYNPVQEGKKGGGREEKETGNAFVPGSREGTKEKKKTRLRPSSNRCPSLGRRRKEKEKKGKRDPRARRGKKKKWSLSILPFVGAPEREDEGRGKKKKKRKGITNQRQINNLSSNHPAQERRRRGPE